jgi:hypothetical protein
MSAAVLVHATGRPATISPAAVLATAMSRTVSPTASGSRRPPSTCANVTVSTPASVTTRTGSVPVLPPTVARIDVSPGARALTVPAVETVATEGSSDDQLTGRPGIASPAADRAVAASRSVSPTRSRPGSAPLDGATSTWATGTGAGPGSVGP